MPGVGQNRKIRDAGVIAFKAKLRTCEEARDALELRLADAEERCALPVQEGLKSKTVGEGQAAPVGQYSIFSTAKSQGNAAAMMRRGRSPRSPNKKKRTKKKRTKKGKTRRKSRKTKKRKTRRKSRKTKQL